MKEKTTHQKTSKQTASALHRNNQRASMQSIAEQAAQWQLFLDECPPEEQAQNRKKFTAWQQLDSRHALAAERVESFIKQVAILKQPSQQQAGNQIYHQQTIMPARKALQASFNQATQRKGKTIATTLLSLSLLISLPAAITLQKYPLSHLNADVIATSGEWQSHTLGDGSKITLAGKGAIDIDLNAEQRVVTLYHGEIYIDVAADANRPFIVKTQYGAIQALGTRFIVNHRGEYQTQLTMLESKVKVFSVKGSATKNAVLDDSVSPIISAGEQIKLNNSGLSNITTIDTTMQENRWQHHQLLVHNWSLSEVLTELNRFHTSYIHFDAASLQHIKVSAVLPLDKPDQALALLNANFSTIEVSQFTPWLTVVKSVEKNVDKKIN